MKGLRETQNLDSFSLGLGVERYVTGAPHFMSIVSKISWGFYFILSYFILEFFLYTGLIDNERKMSTKNFSESPYQRGTSFQDKINMEELKDKMHNFLDSI